MPKGLGLMSNVTKFACSVVKVFTEPNWENSAVFCSELSLFSALTEFNDFDMHVISILTIQGSSQSLRPVIGCFHQLDSSLIFCWKFVLFTPKVFAEFVHTLVHVDWCTCLYIESHRRHYIFSKCIQCEIVKLIILLWQKEIVVMEGTLELFSFTLSGCISSCDYLL